ncbi:MAG TPA: sulfurtransferase TusA family protein [Burkholderiaceae bacterium]|nr:sulfurtransferase TusA family protein [Burkholderiaceae bacterium]
MDSNSGAERVVKREIDTRGLTCPLPILRAKKALADLASGDILKVVSTDPGSMRDFKAFAKQTGNELLAQEAAAGEFIHYLKRR